MTMQVEIQGETWRLREPFRLSRGVIESIEVLVVRLRDARGRQGLGEAAGIPYAGETLASMARQVQAAVPLLIQRPDREHLRELLPAGGARHALDAALWDLEAKQRGLRAWELLGRPEVRRLCTAVTLGIDDDEARYRARARSLRGFPVLKLKADGERHVDLVRWAHEEHPTARLVVDANQAWTRAQLDELLPALQRLGVVLIEQPVAVGCDASLCGYDGAIPLAADESCTDLDSLPRLLGRYQVLNIKLDKCGGLTEGLRLAKAGREAGLGLMVGNMGGSSLGMAPHFVLAQQASFVDLDAPLLFQGDRRAALRYDGAYINPPEPALWG